jgi:hypothetical protein
VVSDVVAGVTPALKSCGGVFHLSVTSRPWTALGDLLPPQELNVGNRQTHAWGGAQASWAHGHRVGLGESRRGHGEQGERARRYALVSRPADGVRCRDMVRQPGGVEQHGPGVLEVSGPEEARRMRTDQGAQPCSGLRQSAWHLLRRASQYKGGLKARGKRAGWERDALVPVLTA